MAWSALQKSTALLLFSLMMSIFVVSPAVAAAQRMLVLATAGSVTIGPGGSNDLPARCLDSYRSSPGGQDRFVAAPASLGSTTVRVGNAQPVPLQSVLDDGRLSVFGAGTEYVSVQNNTTDTIALSVPSASVLAPDSAPETDDLTGLSFIGSTNSDIDQLDLWNASNAQQLAFWGLENRPDLAESLEEVRILATAGWTSQQIRQFNDLYIAVELYRKGLTPEKIIALPDPRQTVRLMDAGWTYDQAASLDGDIESKVWLASRGWSFENVSSFTGDLAGAARLAYLGLTYEEIAAVPPAEYGQTEGRLRLARYGWAEDEIGSLQGNLLVAANLVRRGISRDILLYLGANTDGLEAIAEWSDLQLAAGPGLTPPTVPILRLTTGEVPTYVALFPGFGAAEVTGNHNLDKLVNVLKYYATDGVGPPVLMLGEGSSGDFDAARLTMIAAASGGGGSKIPVTFAAAAGGFPPSGGSGGPFGVNQPSNPFPPIKSENGRHSQTIDFVRRGTVTIAVEASLIDAWYAMLPAMYLGVEDAKNDSGATTLPAADVIAMIERTIDQHVQAEKARQGIRSLRDGAVDSTSDIADQLSRRQYVEIEVAPAKFVLVAFHEP